MTGNGRGNGQSQSDHLSKMLVHTTSQKLKVMTYADLECQLLERHIGIAGQYLAGENYRLLKQRCSLGIE